MILTVKNNLHRICITPLKDVKTSSTANFSRPSLKTENKSAWLEEPLDQYDILGSKSEFSRDFLSLLTTPTDDPCVPEMRSKIFFLQIEITQIKLRTNFKSNCGFFGNPFGLKKLYLDFSFRTPLIFYGTQNFSFWFNLKFLEYKSEIKKKRYSLFLPKEFTYDLYFLF